MARPVQTLHTPVAVSFIFHLIKTIKPLQWYSCVRLFLPKTNLCSITRHLSKCRSQLVRVHGVTRLYTTTPIAIAPGVAPLVNIPENNARLPRFLQQHKRDAAHDARFFDKSGSLAAARIASVVEKECVVKANIDTTRACVTPVVT